MVMIGVLRHPDLDLARGKQLSKYNVIDTLWVSEQLKIFFRSHVIPIQKSLFFIMFSIGNFAQFISRKLHLDLLPQF